MGVGIVTRVADQTPTRESTLGVRASALIAPTSGGHEGAFIAARQVRRGRRVERAPTNASSYS
jgi:hypothetical protein